MATDLRLTRNAFAPLVEADGTPRTKILPYQPVVDACSVCPARCCRLHVKVSLPDAVVWCKTLQVPFFAGMVVVPTEPHEHSFALADGHAEIELARREDGGCKALIDLGGYERCGAYGARPSGCRTYPVGWESEETRGGPATIVCPVPYGIRPDEERQFVADVETAIERWRIHDEIVTAWNDDDTIEDRSAETFLSYALERAGRLMGEAVAIRLSAHPDERLYEAMKHAGMVKDR